MKRGRGQPTVSGMTWHGFNLVDAAVVALLLGGLVGGIRRGLSGELMRVIISIGCVAVIYKYTRPLAEWIQARHGGEAPVLLLISAAVLLVGAFLALSLLRIILAKILQFSFKGSLERIGGALAGLLRSGIVVAILLLLLSFLPGHSLHRFVAEESFFGRMTVEHVQPWYDKLAEKVPELQRMDKRINTLEEDASETAADAWEDAPLGPVE